MVLVWFIVPFCFYLKGYFSFQINVPDMYWFKREWQKVLIHFTVSYCINPSDASEILTSQWSSLVEDQSLNVSDCLISLIFIEMESTLK